MADGGPPKLVLSMVIPKGSWAASSPKPRGDLDASVGSQDTPVTFGKVLSQNQNLHSPSSFLMPCSPAAPRPSGGDGTGSAGLAPRFRDSMASGRFRSSTVTEEGQQHPDNIECQSESEDRVPELTYSMENQNTDLCTSMDSSSRSSYGLGVTFSPSRMRPKQSNATASMSLKSMELEDPTLLRATTLVHILAGCGKHLKTIGGGPREYSNQIFSKSYPTEEIDYFVSHCWRDSRLPKLLALWIHSNIGGAILLSLVMCLILCLLIVYQVLPAKPEGIDRGIPWCLVLGSFTFLVCLSNWHHFRAACGFRRAYFVDKFCVHQGDPDLKRRGVASFAAFIGKSQRMLLLWSPQYFTRLWCTLEVAALVRASSGANGQPEGALPLDFFPLQLATVSCMAWFLQFMAFLAIDIYRMFSPSDTAAMVVTVVLVVAASCVLMRSLTAYARARLSLADQLKNFSIQQAECAKIEDRTKVQERVLKWFENLDTCNQHIREKVKDQVLSALGPSQHYPTRMILPILLINVFDEADYIVVQLCSGQGLAGANGWFSSIGWCCFVGSTVPVCYRLCHYLFYKPVGIQVIDSLLTICAGLLASLYLLAGYYLFYLSYSDSFPLWVPALAALFFLMLLLWLQRADWVPTIDISDLM